MRPGGPLRRRGPHRPRGGQSGPASACSSWTARPLDDPRPRRGVVLHRLPPVVRRDALRQGAVHLGQRRRAPRAPVRLPAQRRRQRQPGFRREVDGWVADSAITSSWARRRHGMSTMFETAQRALAAGIAAGRAGQPDGRHLGGDRGLINEAGYAVNTAFGGHGVGRTMHEAPGRPERRGGRPRAAAPARPGHRHRALVPRRRREDPDGQGRLDDPHADGSRGVHVEHTVAVTADGPLVLTDQSGSRRELRAAFTRAVRRSRTAGHSSQITLK